MFIVDKMLQRDGAEEAADLIVAAQTPPQDTQQLQRVVEIAGVRAISLVREYITEDASDGYGHHVLGLLLELDGETEKAKNHFNAARALGFVDESDTASTLAKPLQEEAQPEPAPPPPVEPLPLPPITATEPVRELPQVEEAQPPPPPVEPLPLPQTNVVEPASLPPLEDPQPPPPPPVESLPAPATNVVVKERPKIHTRKKPPAPKVQIPTRQNAPPAPTVQTTPAVQTSPTLPSFSANTVRRPVANKPGSRSGSKVTAVLAAIAVHVIIALIAAILVILPPSKDEPEIVAAVIGPPTQQREMQKKNVVKQVKKSTSASSAAAPVAKLMRANAVAKFAMPEVTKISTGPLGMGEGDLGSGGFGGGTGLGMGGGETMFGSRGSGGLIGTFYDLKQTPARKPTGFNPDSSPGYYNILNKFAGSRFSSTYTRSYYQSKQKMSFTNLLIPDMSAEEGPKAFNVQREVKPRGWFVHYAGSVVAPEAGQWRFVGRFDDAIQVYVNKRLVFDGSWHVTTSGANEGFSSKGFANGQPALAGKWVNLSGTFNLDIIVGERPGGVIGGGLMIQRRGENYRKRGDGSPVIPLFSTVPISDSVRKRIKAFPYEIEESTPIFKVLR